MGQGQDGKGNGDGFSGPNNGGQGSGRREEKPDNVDFENQRSPSQLNAGKVLMSWKTKGDGEKGEAAKEYAESMAEVKQGVNEAILREQVPPGYHDSIRKYFDTLSEAPDKDKGATK